MTDDELRETLHIQIRDTLHAHKVRWYDADNWPGTVTVATELLPLVRSLMDNKAADERMRWLDALQAAVAAGYVAQSVAESLTASSRKDMA